VKTPELVFLHIPKTAGTSQHRSFRQYYGPGNVFWIGEDCPADVRSLPAGLVGDRLLVGGHKPLSFYPPKRFDPLFCAVLRDPVERAISLFVYYARPELARSTGARQARERILERMQKEGMDPESMLDSIRNCRAFRREISNMQCAYIGSARGTFKGALKSLRRHDFILGTLDDYARFHRRLGEMLDWPQDEPGTLNRSKDDYATAYLDDGELVALLRELNEEDYKLLDFVNREHGGLYVNLRNEARRRQRLQHLPLRPWVSGDAKLDWEKVAAHRWPRKDGGTLPWPLDKILLSESSRLLYMAIPGPANGIVHRLMLDASSVQHPDVAVGLGLGRVLARFNTGLMLDDRSRAQARSILDEGEYFKFAILYEPVNRLVDVYVEKFVVNRSRLLRAPRLLSLIAGVQGNPTANVEAGISFREFVTAIVQQAPEQQHVLWAPQRLYVQGLSGYDKLYRPDQLHLLQGDLMRLKGMSVSIPASALSPDLSPRRAGEGVVTTGEYADCRPPELPGNSSTWRNQLVDSILSEQILDYYAQDCELYNRTIDSETGGGR